MCKKQGVVSHSSSEAEVVSLETAIRLEGIPSLELWEQVLEVFAPPPSRVPREAAAPKRKNSRNLSEEEILQRVDYVPFTRSTPSELAQMVVFEDNDAVLKMTIKRRSPNMRHIARTHRIELDF